MMVHILRRPPPQVINRLIKSHYYIIILHASNWWLIFSFYLHNSIQRLLSLIRRVALPESFRTSIRGFSGSNHEDIFWNFPNWSTSNRRNWFSIYRQPQADCLYHINCLYNFPAYTWRQKGNAFPGLCNGSIFMIQKNLIVISGTEPSILCSEVIRKNNSSMTQLNTYVTFWYRLPVVAWLLPLITKQYQRYESLIHLPVVPHCHTKYCTLH